MLERELKYSIWIKRGSSYYGRLASFGLLKDAKEYCRLLWSHMDARKDVNIWIKCDGKAYAWKRKGE